MPISFVNSATNVLDGTGGTTFTLTSPSGATAGDVMVAFVSLEDDETATCTGWTVLRTVIVNSGAAVDQVRLTVLWRAFVAGDTSFTGNFSASAAGAWATAVHAYRGVNTSDPFIAENVSSNAAIDATITTATVSNTSSLAWSVCAFASEEEGSWTSSEAVERTEQLLTAGSADSSLATYDSNGTVSTGNISRTGTTSISASKVSWIGLLRPTDAAAGNVSAASTANAPSVGVTHLVPATPSASAAANDATPGAGGLADPAAASTTAYDASVDIAPSSGEASASATAEDADTGRGGQAEVAEATATAYQAFAQVPVGHVIPFDEIPATAYDAVVNIGQLAELVEASATAEDVGVALTPDSVDATATAYTVSIDIQPDAEHVAAQVDAIAPSSDLVVQPGAVDVATSAPDVVSETGAEAGFADVEAASYSIPYAGRATVTATAYNVTLFLNVVPPTRQVPIAAEVRRTVVTEEPRVVKIAAEVRRTTVG